MQLLIVIYLIVLTGDFGYSQVVAWRASQFESQLKFDANGVRVGCDTYSRGAGETAILFVHGFNDTPRIWDGMIGEFKSLPVKCVALRLPGFGGTFEAYSDSNADQWTTAVLNKISELKKNHKRVILVGHSLGGAIAIRAIYQKPTEVDGLVLVAPANKVSSQRSPVFSTETWHRIAGVLLIFTQGTESPFPIDVHRDEGKTYAYRTPFTPRKIIDETYRLIQLNRNAAASIDAKTLVVVAPEDVVCDPAATRLFFDKLPTSDKRLVEAKRSGHAVPLDYDAPEVAREIIQFFELASPSNSQNPTAEKLP